MIELSASPEKDLYKEVTVTVNWGASEWEQTMLFRIRVRARDIASAIASLVAAVKEACNADHD